MAVLWTGGCDFCEVHYRRRDRFQNHFSYYTQHGTDRTVNGGDGDLSGKPYKASELPGYGTRDRKVGADDGADVGGQRLGTSETPEGALTNCSRRTDRTFKCCVGCIPSRALFSRLAELQKMIANAGKNQIFLRRFVRAI